MKTIGGFICVRNGFHLDYSWQEAAESLLKVCSQLVLCDSDSTDGTREAMQRMAASDPRITYVNWPWPSPKAESHHWFLRWLRFAQSHLTTDFCIYLDADEVLSDAPQCHAAIRDAAWQGKCLVVDRLNFWRDAYSLVPEGECCGKWCVRFGPTGYPVVSDEPHSRGECRIVDEAVREPRVQVFHLGFLRRKDAFYRKAKEVLNAWFGAPDQRLVRGEAENKELWETECSFTDRLVPFNDYLPDAVQRWLADRGHKVPNYLAAVPLATEPRLQVVKPAAAQPVNVRVCGDLGDIIHAMPILKALGAVNIYATNRGICKALLPRLHLIQPLLESQSCIKSVQEHNGEAIHWDASDFRTYHRWTQALCQSHLLHYNAQAHLPHIKPDFRKPWLTGITADLRSAGRVLIHRTDRYHNEAFPWREVISHYGTRLLMVGTPEEHTRFVSQFGYVEHLPTADLLEVADLVMGAGLVIAGQSCVLALAEALKRPRIAEVSATQPDVIVALSPDAQYVADDSVRLPDVAGSGEVFLTGKQFDYEAINTGITPQGGWSHPSLSRRQNNFRVAVADAARTNGISHAQARLEVLQHTVARTPGSYTNTQNRNTLSYYQMALENALR